MALPLVDKPAADVEVKVYVVSHYGTDRVYLTMAADAKIAAIAYAAALPYIDEPNKEITIDKIWVKDGTKGLIEQTPLTWESLESILHWVSSNPMRAKLVQSALEGLRRYMGGGGN